MADPTILGASLTSIQPTQSQPTTGASTTSAPEGDDFTTYLLRSLDKVNQLQSEADAGVEKLMTGETDNVAQVLSTSRKAGVAFDLLMEIRNKLMDAYSELKQMRV